MTGVTVARQRAHAEGRTRRRGSRRIFQGNASQVAEVRSFIRFEISDHPACNSTVIVASELATNAICHTKSGSGIFMVDIRVIDAHRVAMFVTDQGSPEVPRAIAADSDAEFGRGLMLVEALSEEWGSAELPCCGRVVYAVIGATSNGERG